MIPKLIKLIHRWRLDGIGPLDLIHWYYGRIQLAHSTERKRDGSIRVWIGTGNPFDMYMTKDTTFYNELKAIVRPLGKPSGTRLRCSDVRDRFKSAAKLWLVLRDGSVVEESTVRVYPDTCSACRRSVVTDRDARLMDYQQGLCLDCFTGTLSEVDQFWYDVSTWEHRGVGSGGYRIDYDPVMGIATPLIFPSDLVNRAMSQQCKKDDGKHADKDANR